MEQLTKKQEKQREYQRNWRLKNKEKIKEYDKIYRVKRKDYLKKWVSENLEKKRLIARNWQHRNKEKTNTITKQWRADNREKDRLYHYKYKRENKQKINEHERNRCLTDVNFKLSKLLRSRIIFAVKNNKKVGSAIRDLGCSVEELKAHLESQFKEGMNWENWTIKGWHLDHIKPLASFNLQDRREFLKACHYTNLQPLWAFDNLSKGDRIILCTSTTLEK